MPFPYFWRAWIGSVTWDSGEVSSAPHPAHTKTNKCPPLWEAGESSQVGGERPTRFPSDGPGPCTRSGPPHRRTHVNWLPLPAVEISAQIVLPRGWRGVVAATP